MLICEILEAAHAYDKPDYGTRFQPLKRGDTVRVFHGFHDMPHAVQAATNGLSGRSRAERRYSYEYDNNPQGLYVTLSIDVAKEFTSRVIMEFATAAENLEGPVWPGGGYTVQGQMAQYFGHGAPGRAARNAKRREMTAQEIEMGKPNPDLYGHIPQSDDPHMAFWLTTGREYQALFVGHLNPEDITAFYVSNDPKKDGRYAEWTRLSREAFLAAHGDEKHRSRRVFSPNEDFDGNEFVRRMNAKFRGDRIESMLQNAADDIRRSSHAGARFQSYFENYLWPKQYVPAMRWLIRSFR